MDMQLQSPFFQVLPPELRQTIYTFALTSSNPITDPVPAYLLPDSMESPHSILSFPFLRTCKRIYHEADLSPFYTNNRFNFTRPHTASEFFDRLRQSRKLEFLREISFDMRKTLKPKSSTNPILRKTSAFIEWEHYLTCANSSPEEDPTVIRGPGPLGSEESLCAVNDYLHFSDELRTLTGLKKVVVDFGDLLQDLVDAAVHLGQPVRPVLENLCSFMICLVDMGLCVWAKTSNRDGEIGVIPVRQALHEDGFTTEERTTLCSDAVWTLVELLVSTYLILPG